MKIRHPALIRTLGFTGACLLKAWLGTLRVRTDLGAGTQIPADRRRQPVVYCFWHENLLMGVKYGRYTRARVSQHADGELLSQILRRMGLEPVRGSTTRGGAGALLELLRCSKRHWNIGITPDGPRGPRRRVQLGVVYVAAKLGLPLMLGSAGYEHAWRAPSWDRFVVPYPYSRVNIVTAPLLVVPDGLNHAGLEAYRRLIEEQLHFLDEDAQRWTEGRPRLSKADLPTAPILSAAAWRQSK